MPKSAAEVYLGSSAILFHSIDLPEKEYFEETNFNEEISLLITIKSNSNANDDDYLMVNYETLENSFCLANWIRHTFGNLLYFINPGHWLQFHLYSQIFVF